jgi:hypothetical protein
MSNNFLTANISGVESMQPNDQAYGYHVNRIAAVLNGVNPIPLITGDITANRLFSGPKPSGLGAVSGDIIANRGGGVPGTGAIFFGNSIGLHNIYYDGTRFAFTDTLNAPGFNGAVWLPAPSGGDDTTALQTAITNAPAGSTLLAWPGIYHFTALSITNMLTIWAPGYTFLRGVLGAFAAAAYGTDANFGGTVFRCTATSGTGLSCIPAGAAQAGASPINLLGFILVGPGSGTGVGLTYGSSTNPVVEGKVDIGIMNFPTGANLNFVEDSDLQLVIHACTSAINALTNTNQNTFRLDIQKCTTGYVDDTSSLANVFINPIFQANTGVSATVNGLQNSFIGLYFENPSGTRGLDVFGNNNNFSGMSLTNVGDSVRVNTGAKNTQFLNPIPANAIAFVDNGTGTMIIGNTTNFTFSGTGTGRIFLNNGQVGFGTFAQIAAAGNPISSIYAAAANDADQYTSSFQNGTDGTLGPLTDYTVSHPSATAANRFVAWRAVDTVAYRTIKLNDLGGNVVLGATTSALGLYGHAPVAQPAAPVTLADVIAIIRGCGLSA